MKTRVIALCFTTLTAFGAGAGVAGAAPTPGEPQHPEDWVPVPKPAAVDQGPKPGTTCENPGETGEYVDITGSRFDVEGTQSTSNSTGDAPIPLTQTIKESKSKKWWTNVTVGVQVGKELNRKYSWEYSQEMVWSMGQNIGPYTVKPGETGRLSWGFLVDEFTGQHVRCGHSKTWEPVGNSYFGVAPRERHVEVTIQYPRHVGTVGGAWGIALTPPPVIPVSHDALSECTGGGDLSCQGVLVISGALWRLNTPPERPVQSEDSRAVHTFLNQPEWLFTNVSRLTRPTACGHASCTNESICR